MQCSFCVITRPLPGMMPRLIVLIVIVVAVFVAAHAGFGAPLAVELILGAGLAATQVAREMFPASGLDEIVGHE
jgi:hypothetical protein